MQTRSDEGEVQHAIWKKKKYKTTRQALIMREQSQRNDASFPHIQYT